MKTRTKKMFALLLSLAMVCALIVPAFANVDAEEEGYYARVDGEIGIGCSVRYNIDSNGAVRLIDVRDIYAEGINGYSFAMTSSSSSIQSGGKFTVTVTGTLRRNGSNLGTQTYNHTFTVII